MRYGRLAGLDKDISRLILGCDAKLTADEGAPLWDAFVAAGGTAFDTAHIYAKGACEQALGDWLRQRGTANDLVVTVKGAHTPWCDPENLVSQLHESLDRLGLACADIYIMHRDNPDIPVGEFVDVLNAQIDAGLIKTIGGSNWSVARFKEANTYAAAHGKRGLQVLNNNLSLARMVKPVWDGCISSSDDATLAFLEETETTHFSWSSQARGYFYAPGSAAPLAEGTRPEDCFDSPDNRERRARAQALAEKLGVHASHVAAAWVLAQPFPSYALIGPREIAELEDCLRALDVELTNAQLAWLNLAEDKPVR